MQTKKELFNTLLPLETERLLIRKTSLEDVDMLLKMDKQEMTQKYLGGIKDKTKEERITFLKKKVGMLTVCLKDNTPIGFTGLNINENENTATIGYIYDNDYWNNGYCTEACNRLLDIGFNKLNLNKITADTIEGNISSIKVLEKLGFKQIGTRGKFIDYCILKSEYK